MTANGATAGVKADGKKPRPRLVVGTMAKALLAVIDVAEMGARKYSPDNWLLVESGIERYTDALNRHLLLAATGQDKDEESGLMHMAHVAWNALAVLELKLRTEAGASNSKDDQCQP